MDSPYEKIRALYIERTPAGRMTWEELVGYMLASSDCYVFKSPEFFIMGRAVPRSAPRIQIEDLTHKFEKADCDAWHIWGIWGDIPKALKAMPYELPWCAVDRHGVQSDLRFIPMASIRRHADA